MKTQRAHLRGFPMLSFHALSLWDFRCVTFLQHHCIHQLRSSRHPEFLLGFHYVSMIDSAIGCVDELSLQPCPLLKTGLPHSPNPLTTWLVFLVISPQSESSHLLA